VTQTLDRSLLWGFLDSTIFTCTRLFLLGPNYFYRGHFLNTASGPIALGGAILDLIDAIGRMNGLYFVLQVYGCVGLRCISIWAVAYVWYN
jgi:hypothetical protein